MNFKSNDLEKFKRSNGLLIDVRSPDEYYKGHMPNSINIPIFNNEEREIVGKEYKFKGRKKAIYQGLNIVNKKIDFLIQNINQEFIKFQNRTLNPTKGRNINLYCARGGMRSQSIAWVLKKLNYDPILLTGGYKTYRGYVLNNFSEKRRLIVIGGKTGTGKTKILSLMKNMDYQVIDLEYYANHKGSSFGNLGMTKQPTNEQFENLISEELCKFEISKEVFVEAESANIGSCRIPHEFYKQMIDAKRVEISTSESKRIKELVNTYSVFPKQELKEAVQRIERRLGPNRTKIALESIDNEEWEEVCKAVIDYYDRCYEYERQKRTNICNINIENKNTNEIIKSIVNNSSK